MKVCSSIRALARGSWLGLEAIALAAVLGTFWLPLSGRAEDGAGAARAGGQGLDARAIMERVDAREDGDTRSTSLQMVLIDSRGGEREREIRIFGKDEGAETQQLIVFDEPADLRGTRFLLHDHAGADRADDQWLYLPALRKSKRIATDDQRSSFLGSDFSYADLTRLEIDAYDFELMGEEEVRGRPAWQIRGVPRSSEEVRRTGYRDMVLFVGKDSDFIVRALYRLEEGQKAKYLDVMQLEQIDGIWVATEVEMVTRVGREVQHRTLLRTRSFERDQPLDPDFFSLVALERGP